MFEVAFKAVFFSSYSVLYINEGRCPIYLHGSCRLSKPIHMQMYSKDRFNRRENFVEICRFSKAYPCYILICSMGFQKSLVYRLSANTPRIECCYIQPPKVRVQESSLVYRPKMAEVIVAAVPKTHSLVPNLNDTIAAVEGSILHVKVSRSQEETWFQSNKFSVLGRNYTGVDESDSFIISPLTVKMSEVIHRNTC